LVLTLREIANQIDDGSRERDYLRRAVRLGAAPTGVPMLGEKLLCQQKSEEAGKRRKWDGRNPDVSKLGRTRLPALRGGGP